jgi:hypothetical protein
MKCRVIVPALALLLACATAVSAAEPLVRNGSGVRTKPILGVMYDLELRVPQSLQGADAKTLIEADQPMEFVLTIKSGLINRKRYVEATTEGFAQAAKSGYVSEQKSAFLSQFDDTEFRKGDVIVMRYGADGFASIYRKQIPAKDAAPAFEDTALATLPGLDLKQAVFAIWLGDHPVQESLRKGLLGGK